MVDNIEHGPESRATQHYEDQASISTSPDHFMTTSGEPVLQQDFVPFDTKRTHFNAIVHTAKSSSAGPGTASPYAQGARQYGDHYEESTTTR